MDAKPYVGITGITTIDESKHVTKLFQDNNFSLRSEYIPMMGFLVSYKTLSGAPHPTNKRYPTILKLHNLLNEARNTFTTIHYNTKKYKNLAKEIETVFNHEGIYSSGLCKATQLNVIWPLPEQIAKIKDIYPNMKIILQLSKKAIGNLSPEELAKKVSDDYENLDINYILIDPSGGRGKEFNTILSANRYHAIQDIGLKATIGFAGGLTGDNLQDKIKLIRNEGIENFSIDAEGGLRDKLSDKYGDDILNVAKVKHYLQKAAQTLL